MKKLSQIVVLAIMISILFSDESYVVKAGEIEVLKQDQTAWNFLTELNIFENKDGDTLLAPGGAGEYIFFVKNARSKEGVFTLRLKENTKLPVCYSIQSENGDWLLGSENEKSSLALGNVKVQSKVPANSELQLTLYWEWSFEEGKDTRDTEIGNVQDMVYKILLHFRAEELDVGSATHKDEGFSISDSRPKTGDTTGEIRYIIFAMMLAMLVILILGKREQCREDNDMDENAGSNMNNDIDENAGSNMNNDIDENAGSNMNNDIDENADSNMNSDIDENADSNMDHAAGRCEC